MKTDLTPLTRKLPGLEKALRFLGKYQARDRRSIKLNQRAVGRPSNIGDVQRVAIAKAEARRREVALRRIEAALGRLEAGEFGYCLECGAAIDLHRLKRDPATSHCTKCEK